MKNFVLVLSDGRFWSRLDEATNDLSLAKFFNEKGDAAGHKDKMIQKFGTSLTTKEVTITLTEVK